MSVWADLGGDLVVFGRGWVVCCLDFGLGGCDWLVGLLCCMVVLRFWFGWALRFCCNFILGCFEWCGFIMIVGYVALVGG